MKNPMLDFLLSDYANLRILRTTKELNGYHTRWGVKQKRSAVIQPHRPGRRMPQMRLVVDPRERALHTMLLDLQEKYVGASEDTASNDPSISLVSIPFFFKVEPVDMNLLKWSRRFVRVGTPRYLLCCVIFANAQSWHCEVEGLEL